jgi:serine/threonine protein kinase
VELTAEAPSEQRFSLGKYEVVKYLAQGGMAEVFLARVTGLLGFSKPVVIKRILPHYAKRADFIHMFLDEARIAMHLQHPNIVQTYDVGVAQGSYFIAMEYLHGETVREIMSKLAEEQRRLPIEHAVHIAISIATALHHAHERVEAGRPLGIVHRDVTPQNAMVTFDGTVKLLDFGIAKAADRTSETRAGTLKGKLPYMSPEQCRGEELDRRSDVFSLGIMLYEMTLGRRLFRGVSDFQILKQIVEGEVTRPIELDPSYPPQLEEVVLRALQKPREDRYQSARELLVDLEAFALGERLKTTATALADFVGVLFHDKVEAWRHAAAAGSSLSEHLQSLPGEEGGDDLSLEIEVGSARPSVPAGLVNEPPLEGPHIPVTPPLALLEFTNPGSPSAIRASSEPKPAPTPPASKRSPWLTIGGAVVLIAVGAGLATLRTPSPSPSPSPSLSPPPPPPPSPSPPPSLSPSPSPSSSPSPSPSPSLSAPASPKHRPHHLAHASAPAKPAPTGEGTLVLATTPWCNVTIDKQDRGQTPLTTKLAAGPHTLVLTNAEFKVKRSLTITIEPNQTLRKRLDFDAQ